MRVEYRLWHEAERLLAGKVILRPESPEEEQALRAFREHVGSPQKGRKFEIVFRRRVVGPGTIHEILKQKVER